MSEEVAIAVTEGRGRGLDPMTGTGRGIVATKANTTAAVGTQDIAATDAEIHRLALGTIVTQFSIYTGQVGCVLLMLCADIDKLQCSNPLVCSFTASRSHVSVTIELKRG